MTQQPHKLVQVLVVDDQQLMRDGLASLLSIQEGIEVVGTAARCKVLATCHSVNPRQKLSFVANPIRT